MQPRRTNLFSGENPAPLTFSVSVLNHWSAKLAKLQKSWWNLEVSFSFFFFFFLTLAPSFIRWGCWKAWFLSFHAPNLIPFFWPNCPSELSYHGLLRLCFCNFYLIAYLWICRFCHGNGAVVGFFFGFCFSWCHISCRPCSGDTARHHHLWLLLCPALILKTLVWWREVTLFEVLIHKKTPPFQNVLFLVRSCLRSIP